MPFHAAYLRRNTPLREPNREKDHNECLLELLDKSLHYRLMEFNAIEYDLFGFARRGIRAPVSAWENA